jgi:hypothetical protein
VANEQLSGDALDETADEVEAHSIDEPDDDEAGIFITVNYKCGGG